MILKLKENEEKVSKDKDSRETVKKVNRDE